MAELYIYQLVYLLLVTSATTDLVTNLQPYTERTMDDGRICHPLGKKGKTMELTSERNAAVVLRPTHVYRKWHSPCKFVSKSHKDERLIAVIQNMYLRSNNSQCLDYIRFKRKDQQSRYLCGQIDRRGSVYRTIQQDYSDLEDSRNLTDDFGEFDSEGEIETTIFLSPIPLLPNEKLDLTIVYTPYKDCRKIKSHREDYREIVVSGNSSICMWKEYFCDGYQNCISALCRDEEGCELPTDVVSNGTGTKVTIGAVTTMLLCFIIFIMGLWICRRHKKMCWSSDCAGPSPNDNRSPRADREIADTAHTSVAVSPMLEVAVLPSVLDKDLPPSYDSLFPEQSNPSTT